MNLTERQIESALSRVHFKGGCWPWLGRIESNGYGRFSFKDEATARVRSCPSHRVIYEIFVGPIPDGMELDHLCHSADQDCFSGSQCPHRRCVNPLHLEPVTPRENTLRAQSLAAANARKTHCIHGHPFDDDASYIYERDGRFRQRVCRACNAARQRKCLAAKRAVDVMCGLLGDVS